MVERLKDKQAVYPLDMAKHEFIKPLQLNDISIVFPQPMFDYHDQGNVNFANRAATRSGEEADDISWKIVARKDKEKGNFYQKQGSGNLRFMPKSNNVVPGVSFRDAAVGIGVIGNRVGKEKKKEVVVICDGSSLEVDQFMDAFEPPKLGDIEELLRSDPANNLNGALVGTSGTKAMVPAPKKKSRQMVETSQDQAEGTNSNYLNCFDENV